MDVASGSLSYEFGLQFTLKWSKQNNGHLNEFQIKRATRKNKKKDLFEIN